MNVNHSFLIKLVVGFLAIVVESRSHFRQITTNVSHVLPSIGTGNFNNSVRAPGSNTDYVSILPVRRRLDNAAGIANHWIFVVNTPKTGTGTLQQSFLGSCGCQERAKDSKTPNAPKASVVHNHFELRGVYADICAARHNAVLRTHHVAPAASFLNFLRSTQGNAVPVPRCLAVTSVRNPKTWLPSLFFEQHKAQLCNGPTGSYHQNVVALYRKWLVDSAASIAPQYVVAEVLRQWEGGGDFGAVLKHAKARGKGSLHFTTAQAGTAWRASHCELVLLTLEETPKWSAALNEALANPGRSSTSTSTSTSSTNSSDGFQLGTSPGVDHRCSAAGVAAYGRLKAYEPTAAEMAPLRQHSPDLVTALNFYSSNG